MDPAKEPDIQKFSAQRGSGSFNIQAKVTSMGVSYSDFPLPSSLFSLPSSLFSPSKLQHCCYFYFTMASAQVSTSLTINLITT